MNLSIAAIAGDAFINKLTVSDKTTITGTANINNGVTSANIKVNGAVSTNNMINTGDLSVNTSVIDYARVTGDIKDRGGIINSNYIKNDAGILKIVNTKQVTVTDPIDFGLSQRNGQYCKFNGQNYNTFNGQPFWFDFNFPACVPGTPRIETTKSDIKLYDDVIITGDLTINGTQNIIPRGMTMFWSGSSGTKPSGWSRMITNGRPFIVGAAGSSGVAAANATRYRTGYRYNIEAVWQSDGNGISTKTYGLYLLYKD
jgi:cytoskeletal protein CcmA (bactofilin family)